LCDAGGGNSYRHHIFKDRLLKLSRELGISIIVAHKHYSGTSVRKKGKISKNGPSRLRACLYNAAKSAKRYNHACKALYERLRINGKPHKVAMIAIIRKLLRQVFAVVKNETPFDNELFEKQITSKIAFYHSFACMLTQIMLGI
jgi:hypothetical protein